KSSATKMRSPKAKKKPSLTTRRSWTNFMERERNILTAQFFQKIRLLSWQNLSPMLQFRQIAFFRHDFRRRNPSYRRSGKFRTDPGRSGEIRARALRYSRFFQCPARSKY